MKALLKLLDLRIVIFIQIIFRWDGTIIIVIAEVDDIIILVLHRCLIDHLNVTGAAVEILLIHCFISFFWYSAISLHVIRCLLLLQGSCCSKLGQACLVGCKLGLAVILQGFHI
jgi:hypothetical protein